MLNIHALHHHRLWYHTGFIVVTGNQKYSHAVTLTLIRPRPILNSSEIFSYIHVAYYGIFEYNDPASKSPGVIMFRDTRIDTDTNIGSLSQNIIGF